MIFVIHTVLAQADTLDGWITHNGEALANARVLAIDNRLSGYEGLSDSDGYYQIPDIPSGTYRLVAIPPDPSFAVARVYPNENSICLGEQLAFVGSENRYSIDLPSGGRIFGQLQEFNGSPLANVPIVAEPVSELGADGAVPRLAWTDENGDFEILGLENSLPDSLWRCVFESESLPTQFIGSTYDEDLALTFDLSSSSEIDIGTHQALSGILLSGQVTGLESPIGVTDIHIYSGSQVKTVQSDEDGWFFAEGLPPGEAIAWGSPAGHATTYSPADDRPITFIPVLNEGDEFNELHIQAPLSNSIRVILKDESSGAPIQGASVMLYNDTKTVGKGSPVDDQGMAEFSQLHSGNYSIQYYAENDGYSNGTLLDDAGEESIVNIPNDGTILEEHIFLTPSANLNGTVFDDMGAPVYGADIIATKEDATRRSTSNKDGEYTLYGLDDGSWTVSVQYSPYCPDDIHYVTFYYPDTPNPEGLESLDVESPSSLSHNWIIPLDLDRDAMADQWETQNNLDIDRDDAAEDPDEDGISNLQEYRLGTDPNESDAIKSSCGCRGKHSIIWPLILIPFLRVRRL